MEKKFISLEVQNYLTETKSDKKEDNKGSYTKSFATKEITKSK